MKQALSKEVLAKEAAPPNAFPRCRALVKAVDC
jgi:hypothetical protein